MARTIEAFISKNVEEFDELNIEKNLEIKKEH